MLGSHQGLRLGMFYALCVDVPLMAHSWHQLCRGDAAVPLGLVCQIDMNHHVLYPLQQQRN